MNTYWKRIAKLKTVLKLNDVNNLYYFELEYLGTEIGNWKRISENIEITTFPNTENRILKRDEESGTTNKYQGK
jgi:hypothetical protein